MSLPAVFGTTLDSVPWPGAYLGADPQLIQAKGRQFPCLGPSLGRSQRVGVAWAGNPRYRADSQRSMSLETLIPLLRTSGITWVSLQKSPRAEQLSALSAEIVVWDACSHDTDLAETAAVVATLDLVITTDTCVAHLAGAMAREVWILLPYLGDWRWMQNRESTPWYPTACLVRQREAGNWQEVVMRIKSRLSNRY